LVTHITLPVVAFAVDISPDGKSVAIAARDGHQVLIYEVGSGKPVAQLDHRPELRDGNGIRNALDWHPAGRLLAVGHGRDVYLWDTQSRQVRTIFRAHPAPVVDLEFSRTGDRMLSTSWRDTSLVWDVFENESRPLIRLPFSTNQSPDWAECGILSHRHRSQEVTWGQLRDEKMRRSLPNLSDTSLVYRAAALSPDGRHLAVATTRDVLLWDLAFPAEPIAMGVGPASGVAFERTGNGLWIATKQAVARWPCALDAATLTIGPPTPLRGAVVRNAGQVSSDATGRVVAALRDWQVSVWDRKKSEKPLLSHFHRGPGGIDVSPDGRFVAIGTRNGYGVQIIDVDRSRLGNLLLPEAREANARFTPDSQTLVVVALGKVHRYGTSDWTPQRTVQAGEFVGDLSFAAEDMTALQSSASEVTLYDSQWAKELATLTAPDNDITGITTTMDDERLVTLEAHPGVSHVWDLRALRRRLAIVGLDWGQPPLTPKAEPAPIAIKVIAQ
jgi:WD40 repeat protein